MTKSKQTVHPFFQPRNDSKKKTPSSPPPGTIPYIKKGECSTPYHVPIAKPKFYSDTVHEKQQHKQKNDHEFSRMNRRIFGHGHMTDKKFESSPCTPTPTRIDTQKYIKDHQYGFFQQRRHARETKSNKTSCNGHVEMPLQLSNQDDVEALLHAYFPNWHTFSSCVLLMQSIFHKTRHTDKTNKQWVDKYRPHHLNGLLGERYNYQYLKDWLHQMKVEPLSAPTATALKSRNPRKKTHKKLVMQHNLDDFDNEDASLTSLPLYEDENDQDFRMGPKRKRELKKESMRSNIVLLVGDHGVGKTASVYAIAEQMDYQVFEINAGSKRSGKDLISAVGEMTKSHLVAFGMTTSPVPAPAPAPTQTPALFRQKSTTKPDKKKKLNPSLRSSFSSTSKSTLKHFLAKKKPSATASTTTTQSLILLEEVDILFEDDKGFWASVIELSQNSKRPIIMTCNDPEQIPVENMALQVIMDMKPPTENELLPYLWLICFAEGYTVDPADLVCLVAFLGRDIRQLIQTLELYTGQGVFGHYLGINKDMDTLETKSKCVSSRIAIDTFRLAQAYQQLDGYVKKQEPFELDAMARILENNAFIDTWLRRKENGAMIQETVQDQLNGCTTLWFQDDEDSLHNQVTNEIQCITTVLNNSSLDWIMDEESHWNELCDANTVYYADCKEAIERVLPLRQVYQPNERLITMEYIPYVQQMLVPDKAPSSKSRTRSKRKRLHLPLNEGAVEILTNHYPPIDETQVHIQCLHELQRSKHQR